METFSVLLALCMGNPPVHGGFPSQRPVTRSFDIFFDLRLNKRLSKQLWSWWFETSSGSLWRHCNGSLKTFCLNRCVLGQPKDVSLNCLYRTKKLTLKFVSKTVCLIKSEFCWRILSVNILPHLNDKTSNLLAYCQIPFCTNTCSS